MNPRRLLGQNGRGWPRLPASLLLPCRSVFLFDDVVAPGCEDHLLMIDVDQARDLSNRGPVAAELIGVNDLWDTVFTYDPGQEGLRRLGVAVPLKEDIEYEPVLVYGPPKPVSNAIHARTHLVDMPPGAPTGLPVAQIFRVEGSEFYAPLAQSFVTDNDAAPVRQLLDVPVAAKRPHAGRRRVRRPFCPRRALLWPRSSVGSGGTARRRAG